MLGVLLVAGTFILLRKIERWLHQHIFKVGWLVTRNYQTTTILYYTIFLPGVLLHEITYWLMAGALNVSAERAIQWPEAQEIGELKLNFVRISPKAGIYRRAIITATPLIVALLIIWFAANNIFDLGKALQIMGGGDLNDVAAGLRHLTNAPNFWLWVYLIFTISNTMYPSVPKDLQGWRTVVGAVGIIALLMFVVGAQSAMTLVSVSVSQFLAVFQGILIFIIFINVLVTIVLGTIESAIERMTGNSATFKRGKMITMTREEVVALRRKDRERVRKQQSLATTGPRRNAAADMGIGSVYLLMLPVPGGPDEEIIASPVYEVMRETAPLLPDKPAISPRLGAEMITMPSSAPALTDGQSTPSRPTNTISAASAQTRPEDQVGGTSGTMRINTPASRNTPPISENTVTPGQIDEAVSAFRSQPPAPTKPPADIPRDTSTGERPAAPSRPTRPSSGSDKPSTPFNRPAAPFGPPKPAQDDDDEADSLNPFRTADRPAATKPSTPPAGTPFNRPSAPFGSPKPAAQDDDDEADSLNPFRTADRPAAAKPSTPTSTPFNRPAAPFGSPKPAAQDDDDEADSLNPFRTSDRPAAAKPSDTEKGVPFNRTAARFDFPKPAGDDEAEDEDLSAFRKTDRTVVAKSNAPFKPPSPFEAPKPAAQDDDLDSFRQSDRPAAAKPIDPEKGVPFNRPPSPFGPSSAPATDAPRPPNRPAFGTPNSAPKPVSPSPFGPRSTDEKPASPPATSTPRPAAFPPPRFGSKPPAPFGTKPTSPFGKEDDEDESIMKRSGSPLPDATDDLFEEMNPPKRTTSAQPVVRTGGFGTSRPVPKKTTPRQDSDAEHDLDDLRDTILYEDEDLRYDDEDEEAPDED